MTQQSLVQRAADEFKQGNFLRALDLYRRLGEQLGEKYFRANISLCEKRLLECGRPMRVDPSLKATKVACVMDEFTFHCFEPECNLWALSPDTALTELETFKPDLLFIESAWRGKDDLWVRKVGTLSQELKAVLNWCKEHQVPTVFWNKEDPVHFETFLTVAREFDFVFTTDVDCIARYKAALGHENIYFLPFACQPKAHNPIEKFERKDGFCFAGAYYVRYPERTRDLENYISQFPKYKSLEIFDRNFGKEDVNYQFPAAYAPFIVGTLPFNEIEKAYKGYRYSINLNSIKQSQTMFARRVYELLASNTMTVSNFSRGVRLLFGDLVVSSDNGKEIVARLQCMEPEAEQKHRLAALRKVMQEHTYRHRMSYIASKALARQADLPRAPMMLVTVFVETQQEYGWALENFQNQLYENKRLLIVTKANFVPKPRPGTDENNTVVVLTERRALELSIADLTAQGDWLALMAPSDYYGPNYLVDLVLATNYWDGRLIGKAERYTYRDGVIELLGTGKAYRTADYLPLQASIFRFDALPTNTRLVDFARSDFDRGNDLIGLSIDAFNYCENGRKAESPAEILKHVNDAAINIGIPIGELLRQAENIAPAEFDDIDLARWSASKLNQVFGEIKREKVSIGVHAGKLRIKSELPDTLHEYIYAKNEMPVSMLPAKHSIESYLDATPGLDVQYVFVFYNEKKEKLSHVINTANRNQTAVVPTEAAFFRIGWRIRGNGEAFITSLLWAHRKLQPAKLFGSSDTLILTNHYPDYDDLYRNGFVHSRVKAYKEQGVGVDVFKLRENVAVGYQEFENVDVMTGGVEALHSLLTSGSYKRILIHFLSPLMWSVIQSYPDLQKVIWVHGADIQPWHRRSFNYQTEKEIAQATKESEERLAFWRSVLYPFPKNVKLVFVSHYLADAVLEDLGIELPEYGYAVVHNPIDTTFFEFSEKSPELRKSVLSIRPYASRTYANDISVQVVLELAKKPFFNDLSFTFIGDGKLFEETLNPLRDFFNVKIERRFLSKEEIAKYHRLNGIFLVPTRMDTQGVSRDEAMSSGLVPITNGVAAVPEFVDDQCGILAGPEDVEGLVAGVEKIYRNPDLFAAMSKTAAQKVRGLSAKESIVKIELGLFK